MENKNQLFFKNDNIIVLDAKEQSIGRLATQAVFILTGKNSPDFMPNIMSKKTVQIKNIKDVKFTGRKLNEKKYYHHSGYPGGLKTVSLKKVFEKNPEEVLRKAVYGMLPKNKLRDQYIKRLVFIKKEG
ncbi:50S ribosomal protein L13 [bacterium]|nr:MAG: 50S ribosomal protein L13 [bacterium]